MNRFQTAEKFAAATRQEIPKTAVLWLAAAREPLQELTMAALDPHLSDADFIRLVENFSAGLPNLLEKMDHESLAKLMEDSMGGSMANGIAARMEGAPK